jgi:hypothetical protein
MEEEHERVAVPEEIEGLTANLEKNN